MTIATVETELGVSYVDCRSKIMAGFVVLALVLLARCALSFADPSPPYSGWVPGQIAPAFSVPTLSGTFVYDPLSDENVPLIIHAYDSMDAFTGESLNTGIQCMNTALPWHMDTRHIASLFSCSLHLCSRTIFLLNTTKSARVRREIENRDASLQYDSICSCHVGPEPID